MATARAVIVERHGGPEAMTVAERELPPAGPGEVTLSQKAAGLNFIDVYQRTGVYPLALPPGGAGHDGIDHPHDVTGGGGGRA